MAVTLVENYIYNEARYTQLRQSHPEMAKKLLEEAQQDVVNRWKKYEALASMPTEGKAVSARQPERKT